MAIKEQRQHLENQISLWIHFLFSGLDLYKEYMKLSPAQVQESEPNLALAGNPRQEKQLGH